MNARILSALIRRAELHVVDDGHMFLVSKAQDVAPVVHRFLTDEQEIHPHTRGAGNEHL
jgi:surfactin synthase thioesterase subunit